jgi:hypothetical protein
VPVEEVLIEDGVVVGQGLGQSGQSGCGNLLEGGLVGLVADAAHVEDNAVLRIHVQQVHGERRVADALRSGPEAASRARSEASSLMAAAAHRALICNSDIKNKCAAAADFFVRLCLSGGAVFSRTRKSH